MYDGCPYAVIDWTSPFLPQSLWSSIQLVGYTMSALGWLMNGVGMRVVKHTVTDLAVAERQDTYRVTTCQELGQMSGNLSDVREKILSWKMSIVYFTFGTVSVFNRLLWALCHPLTDLSACFILNIFAVTVYPTGSTDKNMCLKWIRHFW